MEKARPLHPYWCFQPAVYCGVENATAAFTPEMLVVCLILYQRDLLLLQIDCTIEQRTQVQGHTESLAVFRCVFAYFCEERCVLNRRKADSSLSVNGRQKL